MKFIAKTLIVSSLIFPQLGFSDSSVASSQTKFGVEISKLIKEKKISQKDKMKKTKKDLQTAEQVLNGGVMLAEFLSDSLPKVILPKDLDIETLKPMLEMVMKSHPDLEEGKKIAGRLLEATILKHEKRKQQAEDAKNVANLLAGLFGLGSTVVGAVAKGL